MVALHRPDALPTPPDDGLPVRPIKPYTLDKIHFWGNFAEAAALATRDHFPARIYYDPFAAFGVCEVERTLTYGTALVALQVTTPYDLYFFNDIDPAATAALIERVEAVGVSGASVFPLDLRTDDALERARDIGRIVVPWGPKIVVSTGDANIAHRALKLVMPSGWRYVCAVIDPPSAIYHWRALEELTYGERAMDVLTLFPDEMDISRGLHRYMIEGGNDKLNLYYPTGTDWRAMVRKNPRHPSAALRTLYENEMERLLGFKIGQPKSIPVNGRRRYSLVFGSRKPLGIKIWNDICRRPPNEQYEMYLGDI